ncbi:arrestin domain-containing protein 3-like [Bacillus rossius redtenbacheri]|uniref:arrestin domain-containing protein 3-like n=1 Tax=Bacillus rossius redtenbacheri TaxID=93214 RepID=UPI002FDD9CFF
MMGINDFKITLATNGRGVYYSGETLTGEVALSLDAPKSVNLVYVTVRGAAYVSWRESRKSGKKRRTVHYSAEEIFFDCQITLFGNGTTSIEIPAGEQEFPFRFMLPENLPPSFEGLYGSIRYTIKATLDRPWRFNQDTKLAFSVISHVDLNMMPSLKNSLNHSNSKNVCCLCCATGPLTVNASIPFCGVVPGQELAVSVDVENSSNVAVTLVKCILVQQATFIANFPHSKHRKAERKMLAVELGALAKNSANNWERVLTVPSCAPSLQRNCNIIKLDYFLKVKARTAGCHSNLVVHLPLTVGTIPLGTQSTKAGHRDHPGRGSTSQATNSRLHDRDSKVMPRARTGYPGGDESNSKKGGHQRGSDNHRNRNDETMEI